MIVPLSFSFLSASAEATVRDGVLEKRDFQSALIELFLCYLPSQMGTVELESSPTRKLYHWFCALSSVVLFCFGVFCNILSCPISFKDWR